LTERDDLANGQNRRQPRTSKSPLPDAAYHVQANPQRSDGFQRHVAGALHGPFIVLPEQDSADQAGDDIFVGEDADNVGAGLVR
jgi:hypothetical protein